MKKRLKPAPAQFRGCRYVYTGRICREAENVISDRAVSILVERCRTLIRTKITGYFETVMQQIPLHLNRVLGMRRLSHANSIHRLLSHPELAALISDVQYSVEREAHAYISKPLPLADSRIIRHLEHYSQLPIYLLKEYQDTLRLSLVTEIIINQAWDHGCAPKYPVFIELAMEHISVGTKLLERIHCSARQQQKRCRTEVSRQIAGTLEFIRDQLVAELCRNIARMIYDQYDTGKICCKARLSRATALVMRSGGKEADATSQKQAV
jgi:hypothetical protein